MWDCNLFKHKLGNYQNYVQNNHDKVQFIHASDIHLGSHQYRNDYRADDFIHIFQEILQLAITYHVDFILLGGDVFTSLEMLPGKLDKIVKILKDFYQHTNETISIIAIEGNHDIRKFSRGVRFKQQGQSWLKLIASLGLIKFSFNLTILLITGSCFEISLVMNFYRCFPVYKSFEVVLKRFINKSTIVYFYDFASRNRSILCYPCD